MVESGVSEVPYLQITVNTDPLHTDLQLQQALRMNASRESLQSFHSAAQSPTTPSTPTGKSRKHARSSSYTSDLSEISGRFDDADESDALGGCGEAWNGAGTGEDEITARAMREYEQYEHYSPAHLSKRNRGNEWSYVQSPLRRELSHGHGSSKSQSQSLGQTESHNPRKSHDDKRESFSRIWRLGRRSSPRTTSATSPRASNSPHAMASGGIGAGAAGAGPGRRSRFVENMNDGVSEKPPSIFLRERGEGKMGHGKAIFKFGRAIASAFNPFGWGASAAVSAEEERRLAQEEKRRQQQEDIKRVQLAYEELKKSGFQGIVQHDLTQRASLDSAHPAASGAAGPGSGAGHERQRTSLQLRRTKSTNQDSDDRRSRKDLLRQEKLLKKVSALEDKLERARRELRDLGAEAVEVEEPEEDSVHNSPPLQQGYQATTEFYPKRFVPGALPTLPSERCLEDADAENNEHAEDSTEHDKETTTGAVTATATDGAADHDGAAKGAGESTDAAPLKSLSPNIMRTPKEAPKDTSNEKAINALVDMPGDTLTVETPKSEKLNTLKRKSPDPTALEALELNVDTTPTPTPNNTRRSKLQKKGKSDSPGSVGRSNSNASNGSGKGNSTTLVRANSRRRQYTSPQSSPSARHRRSLSRSPSLALHDQLRMETDGGETTDTDTDTKELLMLSSSATDISQLQNQQQQQQSQQQDTQRSSFYMQDQHAINEDHEQGLSPSPSVSTRRSNSNRSRREYIPPVPPLPKDLAATAAKVDKRLAKELARRQGTF